MDLAGTRRLWVITGHYGVGKTEFAVNLALALAAEGPGVMLADLDIVNPYLSLQRAQAPAGGGRRAGDLLLPGVQ